MAEENTTPGDILDLRYARSPDGTHRCAAMIIAENGESAMVGPFLGDRGAGGLARLGLELLERFPTRWPDRHDLEMRLVFMHMGRLKAGRSFAGFDYPESGSLLP